MRGLWIVVRILTVMLTVAEVARATVIVDAAGDAVAVFSAPGLYSTSIG